jgi:phosphatidate phosphatase APP1
LKKLRRSTYGAIEYGLTSKAKELLGSGSSYDRKLLEDAIGGAVIKTMPRNGIHLRWKVNSNGNLIIRSSSKLPDTISMTQVTTQSESRTVIIGTTFKPNTERILLISGVIASLGKLGFHQATNKK